MEKLPVEPKARPPTEMMPEGHDSGGMYAGLEETERSENGG